MRTRALLTLGVAAVLAVGAAPAGASAAAGAAVVPAVAMAAGASARGTATPADATREPVTVARSPYVVTTFDRGTDGAFAESMAVDRQGRLYVSVTTWTSSGWNHGQVWRVLPDGTRTAYGPQLDVGVLTGLALDAQGRLYVSLAAWQDPSLPALAPGVLRINENGTATRVLTLPNGKEGVAAFPNGLAFHDGYLYVSDSTGSIWRTAQYGTATGTKVDTPRSPWLKAKILAPSVGDFGINGIAFRGSTLYGVVADTGRVVTVPLMRNGHAGTLRTFVRSSALVSADGITFDTYGTLWVTANRGTVKGGGALLTVSPRGHVSVLAEHPSWLDYPTQVVIGPSTRSGPSSRNGQATRTGTTLYVTNGAFDSDGVSDVTAVQADLRTATITHAAPAKPTVAIYLPTPGAQVNGGNQRAPLRIGNVTPTEGSLASITVKWSGTDRRHGTVDVPLATPTTTTYDTVVTGLTNGVRYTFTATVCNTVQRCTTSAAVTFTPYSPPKAGAVRATLSGSTVTVAWDAVVPNFSPIMFSTCTVSVTSTPTDADAPTARDVGLTSGSFTFTGKAATTYQARKSCSNGPLTDTSTSPSVTLPA